ncbi:conserved hypothetical protein [Catenulispora acidiphila DSM 44928]|uniref:Uncharacterized protein n=1 Tax=Catenulispora acidiphila (strain DSM 44928 / JCM 14897 / NBRC 102108 / NRRL B-24433 / ID139908) TaxID=479433 RepID=C7Q9L2_CATAD|nr:DUF6204 family protein [Catenulispora acidiphila]ACU76181.1 conserved hypothetical protein [Catenulispora acidiphila DSM 44928]
MNERTFRVMVRGSFDALTEDQRTALLADAAEHDVLNAAFTAEGHLTYDLAMRPFFTFRYLEHGEREEDIAAAGESARTKAEQWLDERGYGYKGLKVSAEDMALMPLAKRQRKAQAAG